MNYMIKIIAVGLLTAFVAGCPDIKESASVEQKEIQAWEIKASSTNAETPEPLVNNFHDENSVLVEGGITDSTKINLKDSLVLQLGLDEFQTFEVTSVSVDQSSGTVTVKAINNTNGIDSLSFTILNNNEQAFTFYQGDVEYNALILPSGQGVLTEFSDIEQDSTHLDSSEENRDTDKYFD